MPSANLWGGTADPIGKVVIPQCATLQGPNSMCCFVTSAPRGSQSGPATPRVELKVRAACKVRSVSDWYQSASSVLLIAPRTSYRVGVQVLMVVGPSQYSEASMMVSTRTVTAASPGPGECIDIWRS